VKIEIRGHAISYTAFKAKTEHTMMIDIIKRVDAVEAKLAKV
jgi:hypothetical protein